MTITEASLRYNRVTIMVLVLLLFGGYIAYTALPKAEDPSFIIKTAVITTQLPGASPQRMEELVTTKIEELVQEIPELDYVSSDSRTGVSQVMVNIKSQYRDVRPIWDNLRRKVERAAGKMPSGVIGPNVNDEFGDVYPVMISLTGEGFSYAEMKDVADGVRDELLRISTVAKVDIFGEQAERIFVEYNNARLAEVGLSPTQLQQILIAQNILLSGGTVTVGGENIALEPSGAFNSVDELRRTLIEVPGSEAVLYLGDLADIYRGTVDPPTSIMHTTGQRSLGLAISLIAGGNILDMGDEVKVLMARLPEDYPIGIDFSLSLFQPDFVETKVNDFVNNLLQAMGIVLLVMVLTLGLRTGLVVASLIPATMLMTLLLMLLFGVGLDQISIAALIIALGMLVDNAIVMSESIMVRMQNGMKRRQAAIDSARELMIPLLTSSLTTSAAFMPMYFSKSQMSEYTGALWQVITMSLLTSWFLSLVMMPMLCMLVLKVKQRQKDEDSYEGVFYRVYRNTLIGILRMRWLSVVGVIAIFILALFGLKFVPMVYMPGSDSGRMLIELSLPLGTSIGESQKALGRVETFFTDERRENRNDGEGVLDWTAYVGSGGGPRYRLAYNPATEGSEHISVILNATGSVYLNDMMVRFEQFCTDNFPDMVIALDMEAMGPGGGNPVEIRLYGRDLEELFGRVESLKGQMSDTPSLVNISDDWGPWTKKLEVRIDQARARLAGVTSQDVAVSLQASLSGLQVTEYREGDKIIPVTLRSVAGDRQDVDKIESMSIFAQASGQSVPLEQLADVKLVWQASKILRRDGLRAVTVAARLAPGANAMAETLALMAWLDEQKAAWPLGAMYEVGGEFESSNEANEAIAGLLPIVAAIMIILLVMQFNSMRRMAIIMLTIPLGIIGASAGLLVTGNNLSFFAILGVYSLAGIIINNAIVLIDRIKIEIEDHGLEPDRAVIMAGQARLRPIVLTTFTTVGGLLPLWLFGGPLWAPMAVTIIFGLLFATLLTLGVVPLLYTLFFRVGFGKFRW